ncbi:DUF1217 domain-containing protein [Aquamicrobium sp. LC103]|uniref:DUF1217 domain-containing protein n=1 Tax=Aquamicrobium sp. LC103 TaxID=1120658 RepID=UPI00063EA14A|nr:DUF1217 domain-containing protein [Aquamicrobium sp. LC103]TKT77476.1 DUF1217 domain-containing protein [Aquamicrobium sp. LC103]
MINTYTNYQLITRDISKSLARVQNQPVVQRETRYYLDNIGKVTSIEEFVNDTRLFNYAMKAHGLSDMAYAKAFMVKAMEGGIEDPGSFANKLTDKRYADFVRSYNFAAYGSRATTYSPALDGTADKYLEKGLMGQNGIPFLTMEADTAYYRKNIVNVQSVDDLLADDRLFNYAMRAHGLQDFIDDETFMRRVLEGGIEDPDSFANRQADKRFAEFAGVFDFAKHGEAAIVHVPSHQAVVDKYMRQTLEEDAGAQNEGVRLALYFERKAGSITSAYQLLADTALAEVVRTVLGLPASMASADIDKQAALINERLDIADLQDPEKLEKLMTRFTTMWEINNPSSPQISAASILISQPLEFGISTDALMAIAKMKR